MSTWTPVQPSARVVQQHYVNARVGEINRQFGDRYKADTIQAFLKDPLLGPRLKGIHPRKSWPFAKTPIVG